MTEEQDKTETLSSEGKNRIKVPFRGVDYMILDINRIDWEEGMEIGAVLNFERGLSPVPDVMKRLLGKQWEEFRAKKYDMKTFGEFASRVGEAMGDVLGSPGESPASED